MGTDSHSQPGKREKCVKVGIKQCVILLHVLMHHFITACTPIMVVNRNNASSHDLFLIDCGFLSLFLSGSMSCIGLCPSWLQRLKLPVIN